MGYAVDSHQLSVLELARSGNLRAIAHWLNVILLPHNLRAQVGLAKRSDCLHVIVEFHPFPTLDGRSPEFRKSLVRFVCRHLWKINSDAIEKVTIAARYIDKPKILWRQSARVISPARRAKLATQPPTHRKDFPQHKPNTQAGKEFAALRARLQSVTLQKIQFRTLRSLLLTGTTAAAFVIGCWLGYADAPAEQTNASASGVTVSRPDTVAFASSSIPVTKLDGNPASNEDGVTLMFSGDVALTEGYSNLIKDDRKWAFAAMDDYRQADVAMVNLDAPFTTAQPQQDSAPKADPANVEVLKNGGVDIVNLADSRTMDYQAPGLEETLKTLDKAGIQYVGAGENAKEARRPKIVDVKGQRIAYLGYSDSELQAATDAKAGVNPHQSKASPSGGSSRVAADIQAIRNQVDWIIVNYHWGDELSRYPADWQIELAHTTIDQGADVVVGHHSHILQGAEIYKGRPIVYSLGNFIFGEKASTDYDTAVLKVGVKDKQMKVELLPVEVKGLQPRVVHGDRAQEILHQVANVSDAFPQPLRSPVILDARSNTILSQPIAPSKESKDSKDSPSEPTQQSHPEPSSESPSQESTPSARPADPTRSDSQAPFTNGTTVTPIPNSDSPTPSADPQVPSTSGTSDSQPTEPQPTNSQLTEPQLSEPQLTPQPSATQPSPAATTENADPNSTQNVPPSDASTPANPENLATPPTSGTAPPDSSNSFISHPNSQSAPNPSGPMVPQQPAPTTESSPSSDLHGDASIAPSTRQAHSLEPRKRRYAEASSDTKVAQL
jgi:poly-gamma-glutamate synthesis protein (capsule biosynthesis protein)